MNDDHLYSEREVTDIIARAIDHQKAEPDSKPRHGLTLAEIERIGEEVGIRPEHLRRATAELNVDAGPAEPALISSTQQVQALRWIPGRLTAVEVENMVAELKNHLGPNDAWWGPGDEVKRLGRTYEWTHTQAGARVTVTDHGDGFSVRVFTSQFFSGTLLEMVGVTLLVGVLLGGLPAGLVRGAFGDLWAILVMMLACAVSAIAVPRSIAANRVGKKHKVEALADLAAQVLSDAAESSGMELGDQERPAPLPAGGSLGEAS